MNLILLGITVTDDDEPLNDETIHLLIQNSIREAIKEGKRTTFNEEHVDFYVLSVPAQYLSVEGIDLMNYKVYPRNEE